MTRRPAAGWAAAAASGGVAAFAVVGMNEYGYLIVAGLLLAAAVALELGSIPGGALTGAGGAIVAIGLIGNASCANAGEGFGACSGEAGRLLVLGTLPAIAGVALSALWLAFRIRRA